MCVSVSGRARAACPVPQSNNNRRPFELNQKALYSYSGTENKACHFIDSSTEKTSHIKYQALFYLKKADDSHEVSSHISRILLLMCTINDHILAET